MTFLSICVSTINERIGQLQKLLETIPEEAECLLIHQVTDETDYRETYASLKGCRILTQTGKGLSRSRNLALKEAKGEWVYLCDDDVQLLPGLIEKLEQAVSDHPECALFRFRIDSTTNTPFKDYPAHSRVLDRSMAGSVSSAEIICKRSAAEGVSFNESFGLGTSFPSGEEYLFVLDMLFKGHSMWYIPVSIVMHPPESTGTSFSPAVIRSKGALIRHRFGIAFLLLNLLYAVRKHPVYAQQTGFFAYLKEIYRGSFQYGRHGRR